MSVKYKFDYSYVTYFLAELNSNLCVNVKKYGNNLEVKEKKTNQEIDYNQLYLNRLDKKISKHITDSTMRIVIHSLNYFWHWHYLDQALALFHNLLSLCYNFLSLCHTCLS